MLTSSSHRSVERSSRRRDRAPTRDLAWRRAIRLSSFSVVVACLLLFQVGGLGALEPSDGGMRNPPSTSAESTGSVKPSARPAKTFMPSRPARAGETTTGPEMTGRWIGIKSEADGGCPSPPPEARWQTESLFGATENDELKRFCLYTALADADPRALQRLPLDRLDADLMGVAPNASGLSSASWQALRDHFLSQVGHVNLPAGPPPTVRLAVVDASPNGLAAGASGPEDLDTNSPHGSTLLNMARDLICDASELTCRARLSSRLAMPYVCFDPEAPKACRDPLGGGYIGLIGELAQIVHAEVRDWGRDTTTTRLVLNLSLGWEPSLGGTEAQVADMLAPIQAIYRALEDAVCRGALPIVAAGNRSAAIEPQLGPTLPALWEKRSAPTAATCNGFGLTPPSSYGSGSSYRPLVYSAGGSETSGEPLDTSRVDGLPRLAAFGDHAVVEFSNRAEPTGTLTGSSVASLVTAATAAVVWSYVPDASAARLMDLVYNAGEATGRAADYCSAKGGCPPAIAQVREVSLCSTLISVCTATGRCTPPACAAKQPLDLATVDLSAFETVPSVDAGASTMVMTTNADCGKETIYYNPKLDPPSHPCPHREFDGSQVRPWTEPQPESIPCPSCVGTFASPGTIYFEIDDLWTKSLSSATLKCGSDSYALELSDLGGGAKVRIDEVPEACLSAQPTFLSFVAGADRAVIVPLALCQNCR